MDAKFEAKNEYYLNFVFQFSKLISKEETFLYKMLSLNFLRKLNKLFFFSSILSILTVFIFFLNQDKFCLFFQNYAVKT